MNSWSRKDYYDDDWEPCKKKKKNSDNNCDPCPPRFAKCKPVEDLHPLPCPAILECGEGANPQFTEEFPSNGEAPIPLASVEIDTTCLCFPNLKIEFSTLIQNNVNANEGDIVIQLSRSCNGGPKMSLKTFNISIPTPGGGITTLPFSFVFCIENAPAKDCTYFVDIVSADPGEGANALIRFENTFISALAVGCARECHN